MVPEATPTGSEAETVERVAGSSEEETDVEVEPVRGPLTRSRSRANSNSSSRSQNTRNAVRELNQQLLATSDRVAELEAAREERARAEGTVDSGIGREEDAEMAMSQQQLTDLLARLVIVSEQNGAAFRRLTEAVDLLYQPAGYPAVPVVAPIAPSAQAAFEGAVLKMAMEALPIFRGHPQSIEHWLARKHIRGTAWFCKH